MDSRTTLRSAGPCQPDAGSNAALSAHEPEGGDGRHFELESAVFSGIENTGAGLSPACHDVRGRKVPAIAEARCKNDIAGSGGLHECSRGRRPAPMVGGDDQICHAKFRACDEIALDRGFNVTGQQQANTRTGNPQHARSRIVIRQLCADGRMQNIENETIPKPAAAGLTGKRPLVVGCRAQ